MIVGAVDRSKGEGPNGKGLTLGVVNPQTLVFSPAVTLVSSKLAP